MLPRTADVVVIGGGVIGTSVTYYLAKKGVKVILLEKSGIASGISSACEGLIFLQTKKPGIHLQLAMESAKKFKNLKEELDFDIEYINNGGMVIIEKEEEFKAMQLFIRGQKKAGIDVTFLDGNQAREKEPFLSEKIFGSTFASIDSKVNPIYLAIAFVKAAKRLGAKVFTHIKVTGIKLKSNKINSIYTNNGNINTEIIVNATGIYAPRICEMVGLFNVPIKPRRGQILVTEAVPKMLNCNIVSASAIAVKYDRVLAKSNVLRGGADQTLNGNILIGSTREFVEFNKNVTYKGMCDIAKHIISMIPKLKEINIIRSYAGFRPYTPDGLPILGKVKQIKGFIMAAGHEGDGVALSPITGELIAGLIAFERTNISLEHFKLERFII